VGGRVQRHVLVVVASMGLVVGACAGAGASSSSGNPNASETASESAAARAPICPNLNPPWAAAASHANDGVPDPTGRIVFGPVHRFDEILGQLISPLFIMDADGSDLVKVFDCAVERPRFSPDGSRIAFSLAMDDDTWQVATIAADGSDLRILTSTMGYAQTPDWSPDGSWLVYATSPVKCSRDPLCESLNETLWRMNADGSDQRLIGNPPSSASDWEPRLSPDGREVVFARNTPETNYRWTLWIRNLETGEERVAKVDDRDLEHPDWSPDGRFIVYHQAPNGPIERIPAADATATPELLPGASSRGLYKPVYSPDGSSIVFGCDGKVCRMSADGSDVVVLFEVEVVGVELNHFDWGPPTAGA
jgi:TolB protein